jgi:hypothetical protein
LRREFSVGCTADNVRTCARKLMNAPVSAGMERQNNAIAVYGGSNSQDRDNFGCLAFAHLRALGLIGMRCVERQVSGPEGLLWVSASVRTLGTLLPVWSTLADDLIRASSTTGGGSGRNAWFTLASCSLT